jgi:hypothetical protein
LLNAIETEIPAGKIVHVMLDNTATTKIPKRAWLDRHPRFVFHYTPKSAPWLLCRGFLREAQQTAAQARRVPAARSISRPQ